ncbi:MAG: FeoB-associated Cys-rich membrane protein [Planctomycetes bacterium]|nr:FeoB-associated Cys-rich membrane protein [Planctomycetota bacterium]
MTETIVVCLIVVVAFLLTGRRLYRSVTGKTPGCSCGQPGVCPLNDAERKETCEASPDDGSQPRPCDDPD